MWLHLFLPFIFSAVFLLRFAQHPWQFALLLLGLVLGFWFILVDRMLHALYVEPEQEFSRKVQAAWLSKNIRLLLSLLLREGPAEQAHLISRSALFMVSFMAIAIYVVTSSTNSLGLGVVLGIGLHYCVDVISYYHFPELFAEHFLWQIKRKFSNREVKWMIGGFLFYFLMLTLLSLRS